MGIYSSLINVVAKDWVSNSQEELFIYSRDPGAQHPRKVDYVVMPKTVDEVQKVVVLANKEKIPITPLGGGFTLSALVVPNKGGIVWKGEVGAQKLAMERMDPNTAGLIKKVKGLLDPNGIMNPGNWEK